MLFSRPILPRFFLAHRRLAFLLAGLALVSIPTHPARADDAFSQQAEDARIRQYRTADVSLTITDANGAPRANTPVTVSMTRQKFLFGSNALSLFGGESDDLEKAYEQRLAAIDNYATLPFYWDSYEATEGQPAVDRLRRMAEWLVHNGVRPKGHPLVWHYSLPQWLYKKPTDEVAQLQTERLHREISTFAGLVDSWEPVNENMSVVASPADNPIGKLARSVGADKLMRDSFATARAANPKATLILNDFDTSNERIARIAAALHDGVTIDAVGVQLHMHQGVRGAGDIWDICERFGKLGIPIQISEVTILSGHLKTDNDWFGPHPGWDTTPEGEKLQAQQAVDLYRLLYSHPAVSGITWWDLTDYHAWQDAPAGLLRKDMTPKPAYDALLKLIRTDWWTGPLHLTTDSTGKVNFHGYLGDYKVETSAGAGTFNVDKAGTADLKVTD
jgi:endo-1,4-beta-xylanase